MLFWIMLKVSLQSLMAHKMRAFLAMLGIIFGVASMIATLSLVRGAEQEVMRQVTEMGSNLILIRPGQLGSGGVVTGLQQNLTLADSEAVAELLPAGSAAAPVIRGSVQIKHLARNTRTVLVGTSPAFSWVRAFELARGRMFNDAERSALARVAVLGPTPAQNLFGGGDPVGQPVRINGITFTVVGVFKPKGDQGFFNLDDQVVIPYPVAMRQVFGLDFLHEIHLRVAEGADLTAVIGRIVASLRHRHRLQAGEPDDFYVRNMTEIRVLAANISRIFKILVGTAVGISMLIGGIGIMNIMLVTVRERTREIGIRKAIGALRRDILRQFLLEALIMSLLGGGIGMAIGIGVARLVPALTQFTTRLEFWGVMAAFLSSAAVGVFFGYYPARRAALLDPIEALRYE